MRSSTTDILEFLKNVFIMHELKTGLYAEQIDSFWMFPERFLSLIRFANDPYTRLNRINASRLALVRKTRKHVNRGQTQCGTLFVISKASFTKTSG